MSVKLYQLLSAIESAKTECRLETDSIIHEADYMPEADFWPLVDALRKDIDASNHGTKSGIHNFFCHLKDEQRAKVASFIKTYNKKVKDVHNNDDIYEYLQRKELGSWSDDGWHDFTDSLPLAGQEAYNAILETVICKGEHPYAFENREWYVSSTLKEKAQRWLADDTADAEEIDLLEEEKNRYEEKLCGLRIKLRAAQQKLEAITKIINK